MFLCVKTISFQTYKTPSVYSCDSDECRACRLLINNAFATASGDRGSPDQQVQDAVVLKITVFHVRAVLQQCLRLQIREAAENATTTKEPPAYLEEVINLLTPKARKRRSRKDMKQKCACPTKKNIIQLSSGIGHLL
ncbi:unnamed protein product [Gongylonema pulchrum]|uniref:Saposin B-type domain-containing protein n=1 Tax=Gongylonema pulchrum TaxID=637853 RepID=A0A183DEQ6_9BILA|nr:unnamed protein product [Gongylonema pulchrum]